MVRKNGSEDGIPPPSALADFASAPVILLGSSPAETNLSRDTDGKHAVCEAFANEVLPRLLLLKAKDSLAPEAPASEIDPSAYASFYDALRGGDRVAMKEQIEDLSENGVSPEAIRDGVLTKAARHLGVEWEEDTAEFVDVTIGMCELHRLAHEQLAFSPETPSILEHDIVGPRVVDRSRTVYLTTLAQDQHTFGLTLVAEAFRQYGWRTVIRTGLSRQQVMEDLESGHFDVLALSASNDIAADGFADEVKMYRQASCNPDLRIIIGGRAFDVGLGLASTIEADFYAKSPSDAVAFACKYVAVRRLTC
ncbi:MAG: cobalamin B12-binding domain-containing protein [Pseudomonadota bacterium]